MNGEQGRPGRGSARRAILGATVAVIAEEGIAAVTHRRVAERAGVSPGSTTHHFAGREELLREAFRFYLEEGDRVLGRIDDDVRARYADPRDRVRAFLAALVDRELADPGLLRAEYEMLLFAVNDDELAAYVRRWEARWVAFLASELEAAGRPRAIEGARTLLNLLRGFEVERLVNPDLRTRDFERRLAAVLGGGFEP